MNNEEINFEYSSMLNPPVGYNLAHAIGTTYSLDLKMAISIPIAFHFRAGFEPEILNDPFKLFLSLRDTASKVDIFCQKGGISAEIKDNRLFRFIEKSINEISIGDSKSFHPKIWILRFQKEGSQAMYRIINLTRNMTFDTSWDMVVAMEGEVNVQGLKVDAAVNQPLFDFIRFLYENTKKEFPESFLNELLMVKFRPTSDDSYNKVEFIPLGIPGYKPSIDFIYKDIETSPYSEAVVVSPFLSESIIDKFSKNISKITLISRYTALREISQQKLITFNCQYINDNVVSGASNEIDNKESTIPNKVTENSEADTETVLPLYDLHAKAYLLKYGMDYDLYIGSANASHNAFYGNIEFLIKLSGTRRNSAEQFRETYFTPVNDFLVKYEPDLSLKKDMTISPEKQLEQDLKILIEASIKIKVVCSVQANNNYTLELDSSDMTEWKQNSEMYVRPISLLSSYDKAVKGKIQFPDIALKDLSCFFILTVLDKEHNLRKSCILKLEVENMPGQREEAVVRSLISNKKDFFRLLRLLLSDDILDAIIDMQEGGSDNGEAKSWGSYYFDEVPLFEKMMKAASREPSKLKEIESIVQFIEKISPDQSFEVDKEVKDFLKFWNSFKDIVQSQQTHV